MPLSSCTISWSMMERIEITTRFTRDGVLVPIDFTLGETTIPVLDIGRRWEDEGGQHILVMDAQQRTYHLLFKLSDLSWYLVKDQIQRTSSA